MSSLDAAREQASNPGAFAECLAAAAFARQELSQLPGLQLLSLTQLKLQQAAAGGCVVGSDGETAAARAAGQSIGGAAWLGQGSCHTQALPHRKETPELDPLILTLSFQGLGLTGYEAAERLESEHHIVPELATPTCVVLAMSIGSTMQHAEALVAAAACMCSAAHGSGARPPGELQASSLPSWDTAPVLLQPAVSPRAAYYAEATRVPLAQAAGRVSAELLCPYPPGVPAVLPGEVLTENTLSALLSVRASGGRIAGCADPTLQTIAVLSLLH
jgi:arginine decarboxylase